MKKIVLLLAIIFTLSGCSWFSDLFKQSEPILAVKHNMVLHEGLAKADGFNINIQHKFMLKLKATKDIIIKKIDYSISIPNQSEKIEGTFEIEEKITLNPNWDFKEYHVKSEEMEIAQFCEQMSNMYQVENDVFSMKVNLTFHTVYNDKVQIDDIIVQIKKSNFWDTIKEFVIKYGCNPSKFWILIKDLF